MSIFENDRPLGYDDEKDGEPRIHPERLADAEKLAIERRGHRGSSSSTTARRTSPLEGGQCAP